eukprot:395877_1
MLQNSSSTQPPRGPSSKSKSKQSTTPLIPDPKNLDPYFTNPIEYGVGSQKWNYLSCARQWLPGEGTFITYKGYRYLIGPSINIGINGHIHYCYKYPLPNHKNTRKNGMKNGIIKSKPSVETLAAKIVPNRPEFEREIITLRALQYNTENICKLHNVISSSLTLITISELAQSDAYHFFVNGGYIKHGWNLRKPAIREYFAKLVIKNIVNGLAEMHKLNYLHRDLKLLNILLYIYSTNNSEKKGGLYICAKLTDFGHSLNCNDANGTLIATKLASNGMTKTGTIGHVAPELFKKGTKCDNKIDIWSLGIVIFTMLIPGHLLFGKYKTLRELERAYDEIINKMNPWSNSRPKWWSEFERLSPEARDLILWTTRWNPKERPNIKQILKHQWFLIGKSGYRQNYRPNLKYFDMLCASSIAQE